MRRWTKARLAFRRGRGCGRRRGSGGRLRARERGDILDLVVSGYTYEAIGGKS